MEPHLQGERVIEKLYDRILHRNPGEREFHQAVWEVLESLGPVFARRPELLDESLVERLCETCDLPVLHVTVRPEVLALAA